MKMLFFSPDTAEVEQVSREFTHAGIACEVRNSPCDRARSADTELWIRNDRDCNRALLLCVRLSMGFAKRPVQEPEPELEADY